MPQGLDLRQGNGGHAADGRAADRQGLPAWEQRDGSGLPDLVASIAGRGVEIDVVGKIDSRLGGLRARFEVLPDAR